METRQTPAAVTPFLDVVLPLPPGLDERQTALAQVALTHVPRPPRVLPPRLVLSEALQMPVLGDVFGHWPGLVVWLRRHALTGARGIGRVSRVQQAIDLFSRNTRNVWWVSFDYVVDGETYRARVRAIDADAADADNARVVPLVVDRARPHDAIVWWSALDIR
jgi:hypothetical protein